jgi:aspartyl protease family protein
MNPRFVRRSCSALLVLLPALTALAVAADPPADAPLKEKGLRRSGTVYVLTAEAEVQKKLNAARALYRVASATAAQKAQFEQGVQAAQEQVQQLEQELIQLNSQLAQNPPAQLYNQLVAMINVRTGQLNTLRRQSSDESKQLAGARLAASREEFIQAVLELRKLVDKTNEEYASLAADEQVKATLEALNRPATVKTKFALGPSRTYQANVKLLERVEATVLTEDVELRRQGGVYWVDATFNGKVTRGMIFDTGASDVVLSADLAAQIGLKPGPDTPSVTAHVADGSEVKAYRMVVPSIRVGKFTVNNVDCVVMPPDKKDVAPLLGQTFQRHFSVHLNVGAGKLVLSRIETGADGAPSASTPDAPAAPKAKASSKTGRGRRTTKGSAPPATDGGQEP